MAISTEKDSVEEVHVIAIKLPFDLQERLLSFPFLHLIRDKYPKAEVHFITPKKHIEVLNLLPFTAYYHEFDEDEIQNLLDVHRYCATAKIYKVDLYISLTNSFIDASIGLALNAKERLGFSDGWKTILLTKKTTRPQGHHLTEDFLTLYKTLFGENLNLRPKVISRDVTAVIKDWDTDPYIAINLSPIRHAGIEEEIKELINYFDNQKIILFASEDQEKIHHLIEPFMNSLNKRNNYVFYTHTSWIELAKMLAFSRGLITFNGPIASLAAYMGTRTVVLFDTENPQRSGPLYFLSETLLLNVNDPTVSKNPSHSGSIRNRRMFNMNEVFGRAFEFFRMIIK